MVSSIADRARAFLRACEGSGEGGRDGRCFEVACCVIERFDLPREALLDLLVEWDAAANTPPLGQYQVQQRLSSALRTTRFDPAKANGRSTNGHHAHHNGATVPATPPAPVDPPAAPLPTDDELERARETLLWSASPSAVQAREYLARYGINPADCGWGLARLTREECGEYGLPQVAAGVRFLIPVVLPDGTLGDVRRYRGPFGVGKDGDKVLPWAKGHGSAKPYGWHSCECGDLVWCEGEKDCAALRHHGVNAVSHTCGASSARKVAEELPEEALAPNTLTILFDHDQPGREAAAKLSSTLLGRGLRVRVASWPDPLPDGTPTPQGFDAADWFAQGFSVEQLSELVLQTAVGVSPIGDAGAGADTDDRPQVVLSGRQLREKVEDALSVLQQANNPPALFVRGGQVVQIRLDERQWPIVAPVTVSALRGRMAKAADWLKLVKSDEGEWKGAPQDPPKDLAEVLLAAPAWPFPAVETVTQVPTLRPDGTLNATPGYDADTRTYYVPPPGFELPEVPDCPTSAELAAALDALHRPWAEFPWADEASYANLLALLLTAVLRPAIAGPVPLALIEAPQAGTGKSLLADSAGIVALGRSEFTTAPATREEWAKEIGTQLFAGRSIIAFDNVDGRLDAPELAAVLTMEVWTKRQLGGNSAPALAQRATWIATGNNVRLGGDLPRRCYPIKIDARTSRPWERQEFTIKDLRAYLREHRGELLAALLTLARAWFAAGQPATSVRALGSFEQWTRIVGGILNHAGVAGFLGNLEEMYQTADEDGPVLESFLRALQGAFGGDAWTVRDMVRRAHEAEQSNLDGDADRVLRDAVPEWLWSAGGELSGIKLGKLLKANCGRRFGADNIRAERAGGDTHGKVARWCVQADAPAKDLDAPDYSPWEDASE